MLNLVVFNITYHYVYRDFRTYDPQTVDEWTSVLSLSSKWAFAGIREIAIEELADLTSAVDRVLLGRAYSIESWLTPAYMEICKREKPLGLAEGMRLGMHDAILINQIRYDIRYSEGVKCGEDEVRSIVEKKFLSPIANCNNNKRKGRGGKNRQT